MLKELKENTDQEQKEIWKGIYEQNEIINKRQIIVRKAKSKIWRWTTK